MIRRRVAKVCRILPDTDRPVIDSEAKVIVLEPGQIDRSVSKQVFDNSIKTGGASGQ